MKGEVVNVQKGMYHVRSEDGDFFRCLLRGKLLKLEREEKSILAVGDEVLFERLQKDQGIITAIEERRSRLVRKGAGKMGRHLEQVIAANIDQLLVVVAVKDPPYKKSLIERYITSARSSDLDVIIVFNKADLGFSERTLEDSKVYGELGYIVKFTSVLTGTGIDELAGLLRGKSTVLAGNSGVGKSSLVNALLNDDSAKTGEVSSSTHKGKHTTTSSSVYYLSGGGKLIDVPGMREFAVNDTEGLDEAFNDIAELSRNCRFNDCTHTVEPGCAVLKAVEEGTLEKRRLRNYLRIKQYE
jgi:ribosome biogenesis GTPase